MSPTYHFFFVGKPKNSTEKKSIRKCHEETLGQNFSPARKIPRLFSDIRQSYLISFYHMRAVFIAFIACDIALFSFVAFIACDNAGGAVLGNVVRPDDFERRVLHDVHRRRCGGGGGGRGRRRGLDGAA